MEEWICKHFRIPCFVLCSYHNWMYCLHPDGKGAKYWHSRKSIGGDSANKN